MATTDNLNAPTIDIGRIPNLLAKLHPAQVPIELVGGPGTAKTSIMERVRQVLQASTGAYYGLITKSLVSMSVADAQGVAVPVPVEYPDGTSRWSTQFTDPHFLPVPREDGEHGILMLDEFGQMGPDHQKILSGLMAPPYAINGIKLPPGWTIFMASNRAKDKAGVQRRLMHMVNRICTIETQLSPETLAAHYARQVAGEPEAEPQPIEILGPAPFMGAVFQAYLHKKPNMVLTQTVPETPAPYCTPRSFENAWKLLSCLQTQDERRDEMLPAHQDGLTVLAGTIGSATAHDIYMFGRQVGRLPDFNDIVANPTTAMMPRGLDAMLATIYSLPPRVGPKTINPIMEYVTKRDFPLEQKLIFVNLLGSNDRARVYLHSCRLFIDFVTKHQQAISFSM